MGINNEEDAVMFKRKEGKKSWKSGWMVAACGQRPKDGEERAGAAVLRVRLNF